MKLRMQNNAIRFRLTEKEVKDLKDQKALEEVVCFPQDCLYFLLRTGTAWKAELTGTRATVTMPEAQTIQWAETDKVGLDASLVLEDGQSLEISVEKDIKWMKPREKTIVKAK